MVWTTLGSLSIGSLLTLVVKAQIDRRTENRATRRALYVDLLKVLTGHLAFMRGAVYDRTLKPTGVSQEHVDSVDALLKVDATPAVRDKAEVCFELMNRFGLARENAVPIEREDGGFYVWMFDQVQDREGEDLEFVMRVWLAGVVDRFDAAVDALAAQVRRELHGARSR